MTSPKKPTTTTTTNEKEAGSENKPTLADRLETMAMNLDKHDFQMNALHTQWRTYLALLSFAVLILSVYQMHVVSSTCLNDIQAVVLGADNDTAIRLSGAQTAILVLKDSASVLLAIIMAFLVCLFLRAIGKTNNNNNDDSVEEDYFSHPLFLAAQFFTLPIFGIQFYYAAKLPKIEKGEPSPSCLDLGGIPYDATVELPSQAQGNSYRQSLPAVLVSFVIVTVALFFMNKQRQTMHKNKTEVANLRSELDEATTKAQDKKKA